MSEGGPSNSIGRLSSFGGTKSAKKESRPIADKNFQIEAQAKVFLPHFVESVIIVHILNIFLHFRLPSFSTRKLLNY